MELVDIVINRIKKLGYKYEREFLDVKNIPIDLQVKSAYITMQSSNSDNQFPLKSSLRKKSVTNIISVHFVDKRKNIDLGKYLSDKKTTLSTLLSNTASDKIPNVILIEIKNNRYEETYDYIVFSIDIAYTEFI